ncbi:MAG: PEP-CTERM sorting domain-containing protein [Planctomycetales bacterium]
MTNNRPFHLILSMLVLFAVGTVADAALVLNSAQPITHTLLVNPIIVSDDGGGNTATFMGTPTQEGIIKQFVDDIWAQAGIDVNWLTPMTINNTEILDGSVAPNGNNPRPTSDLSGDGGGQDHETLGAGVKVPGAIDMFFVNIAAGFPLLGTNSVAGLAERPGDDISLFVGSSLPGFLGGQEVVASVIAHEIGHNLNLPHTILETQNLMHPGGDPMPGDRLTGAQISTALSNPLSTAVPVPEPSTYLLLATAAAGGWFIKRRKNKKLAA